MKVELGAFEKRDGWFTIDKDSRSDAPCDLNNGIPLYDNTVDQIYSSHLLEHFFFPEMEKLLKECYRVLKVGGLFEAAVLNMRPYIEAYLNKTEFVISEKSLYKPAYHYFSKIDLINYMGFLDGIHRFMFDEENLPLIIKSIGFREVKIRPFKEGLDMPERQHESIYVEGLK
jgi:predicted SAM-dependent methyltransferase